MATQDYDATAKDSLSYNPGAAVGLGIRKVTDIENPMGSWTGLDPMIGAPLSGALIGAGLGGLYGGARSLFGGERRTGREGFWKGPIGRRILYGSLAGAGVGGVSGVLQKLGSSKQANNRLEVERIIRCNHSMSHWEREQIIQSLKGADFMQLQRLAALAAAGMLTAVAAKNILGLGTFGSVIAGGIGAMVAKNYFSGPKIFV